MTTYVIRRILFMVPTLLGISLLCFALIQALPGGPVEEVINRLQAMGSEHRHELGATHFRGRTRGHPRPTMATTTRLETLLHLAH